jgi:hypothetical protein
MENCKNCEKSKMAMIPFATHEMLLAREQRRVRFWMAAFAMTAALLLACIGVHYGSCPDSDKPEQVSVGELV